MILWWQVWKNKWTISYSETKSGLYQNIKSIQEEPQLKKWFGLPVNSVYSAVVVKEFSSLLCLLSPSQQ